MTPIEKLDAVLKSLSSEENRIKMFKDIDVQNETNIYIKGKGELDYADTLRVLKKLVADKYTLYFYDDEEYHNTGTTQSGGARPISTRKTKTNEMYSISFEGEYFIKEGGYASEKRRQVTKTIFKWTEVAILLASAVGTVYYARQSYTESVKHDTLELENKVLKESKLQEDSMLKEKDNQLSKHLDIEKALQKRIDSLSKVKEK